MRESDKWSLLESLPSIKWNQMPRLTSTAQYDNADGQVQALIHLQGAIDLAG